MTITPDAIRPNHYHHAPHGIPGEPFDFGLYMTGVRFTAFRYVWRAGFKGGARQDLEKAAASIRYETTHDFPVRGEKPGHLTTRLTSTPYTLRKAILIGLWNRNNLDRVARLIDTALLDPEALDEEV